MVGILLYCSVFFGFPWISVVFCGLYRISWSRLGIFLCCVVLFALGLNCLVVWRTDWYYARLRTSSGMVWRYEVLFGIVWNRVVL